MTRQSQQTPMMKQWFELKAQAGSSLLFFRLGDFYELFGDDAIKAAPLLGVALTSRGNRGESDGSEPIPLCGVPVANFDHYLNKALDHGVPVALAEQMHAPEPGKTIVRRSIVQHFTPGMRLLKNPDEKPHYIAVLFGKASAWSLAAADAGTGHLVIESGSGLDALTEIINQLPIEDLRTHPLEKWNLNCLYRDSLFPLNAEESESEILHAFQITSRDDIPKQSKLELVALGTLFRTLRLAHPEERLLFRLPRHHPLTLSINAATRRNLSLFEPAGKSLFDFLDQTKTVLGRRELKAMLQHPTQDLLVIQSRQDIIGKLKDAAPTRRAFRSDLGGIQDLHRILRRRPSPHDLFRLLKSLTSGLTATKSLPCEWVFTIQLNKLMNEIHPLIRTLESTLRASEDHEWGWIKSGVNSELDELRSLKDNAGRLLSELEEKLRSELQVSGLKIKFHQVFGYVAEVTSLHRSKIPARAKIIQTLANSERFKVDELQVLEEKILSLDARIHEAEASELDRLRAQVDLFRALILSWCDEIATLDALQALAEVSSLHRWTTPITKTDGPSKLRIEHGTHPLVRGTFVPLSFELSSSGTQLMLLTGPNMAGKSTVLRVAALSALLHQIGSDVPATRAELSLMDRILCRMGANDDLASGQSTFYVEMSEVALALQGATSKSLLVLDEIGRGTSTYDGMSLAWAITEALHELGSLSLIATHYLELAELEFTLPRLRTFHLGVQEFEGQLVFTRKLEPGAASKSYGIQVARLAEMPAAILRRAEQKLNDLERKRPRSMPLFDSSLRKQVRTPSKELSA